jgi:hypothetical protein
VKIHRVSLLHAEEIITELIEAVIDAAGFPLILNRLDAAFLYALKGVLQGLRLFGRNFGRRLRGAKPLFVNQIAN